ncbi:MAG: S8 family serine peptidase [Candidatus Moduliflexus flocculans]|nr:S8 family serine peptidase [Candidatus Moduliflexus flocculans]
MAGWDFQQEDNDADDEVDYGHGTGEAEDGVGEANNGSSFPGVAPSAMFVPLKVADSFIAVDTESARAVIYAVDNQVDVISEALGTVSGGPVSQAAIDYAYRRGIPIIASAADEQSRHHNLPAAFEHTIWVNSIRDADGTFALARRILRSVTSP